MYTSQYSRERVCYLAELCPEPKKALERIIVVVVDHIPCGIPAKRHALHVVRKDPLRNPHNGEGMYHPYEQVLLLGVGEELHIPEAAVMADHRKAGASPCIPDHIDRIHEAPVHLVSVSAFSGVSPSAVPIRLNGMPRGWDEIVMAVDVVLQDRDPSVIAELTYPVKDH